MKKVLAILLSITTIVVIAFAALDRREGLWQIQQQVVENMVVVEDSITTASDSTLNRVFDTEIKTQTDTTAIEL